MIGEIINITEDKGVTKQILKEGEGDAYPKEGQTVEGK